MPQHGSLQGCRRSAKADVLRAYVEQLLPSTVAQLAVLLLYALLHCAVAVWTYRDERRVAMLAASSLGTSSAS